MARTRTSFDSHWNIHVGDDLARPRRVLAKGGSANGWSDLTVEELKEAGRTGTIVESMGDSFQVVILRPSSNDAVWEPVDLPHDWRVSKPPAPDYPEAKDYPRVWQGFFPSGVAYYRKVFDSPTLGQGNRASITFDGIAGFSDVWLNGFWVGQQSTNYSPLSIDVTEFLRSRSEGCNVLLVRSDSTEAEGWWYEGGGIYRHTWLDIYNDVHIARDGLHVVSTAQSKEKATVSVTAEVYNESAQTSDISLDVVIMDMEDGREVTWEQVCHGITVTSCRSSVLSGEASIIYPKFWELGKGRLYMLTANILNSGGKIVDSVSTQFGIRKIEFVQDGIVVNGKWAKLYGGNIHQDWAVFGVALPDRVIESKLELCAEMGINAIRTAHHAPTPELVDHADRMGLLLLLENRLLSASSFTLDQLRGLIRRFRNRPSVLMWSIENEEIDLEGTPVGRALLSRMVKETYSLDPNRPTNVGGVVALDDEYHRIPDVVGMHYRTFFGVLDKAVEQIPDRPHVLDEEGLYPSTRGVYQYNKDRAYAGSLSSLRDVMMDTPRPAANAALMPADFKITGNIAAQLTAAYTHPKVSGVFVWAALDYMGEPTPQRWPATTSSYGARDLCGIPKDYYWLLRSLLRPEPLVHAFPHWTWPGKEGQKLPFRAYTNCESVEFLVNGVAVAHQTASGSLVVEDNIEYHSGELLVRGYNGPTLVAEHRQVTAGEAAQLILSPDRTVLCASGQDICFIRAAIADEDGNLVMDASHSVEFDVKGSGQLVGVHNADPSSNNYKCFDRTHAFNGFVGVFVRASDRTGEMTVSAKAEGIPQSSLTLTISESEAAHKVHRAADEAQNKLFGLHTRK